MRTHQALTDETAHRPPAQVAEQEQFDTLWTIRVDCAPLCRIEFAHVHFTYNVGPPSVLMRLLSLLIFGC